MYIQRNLVRLILCSCLFGLPYQVSAKTLFVNTTSPPPFATKNSDGYHDLIAHEAFRRVGHDISISLLPGERSLRNLNEGIDDATLVRISGLENAYPNMVMVPEKIMDFTFVAFSNLASPEIKSWADLEGRDVAFLNGWKIFEANTERTSSVIKASKALSLFSMLEKNRTEVVLFEKWAGLKLVQDMKLENIVMHDRPLAVREMFMYVHRQHLNLVPDLANSLAEMKRDGTYDLIFNETLAVIQGTTRN